MLAGLLHVKKVWVKGDEYHLTAKVGWDEVECNQEGEKPAPKKGEKPAPKKEVDPNVNLEL